MIKEYKLIARIKRVIKAYFDSWLSVRIPIQKRFTLNRKNIFIFPSKFGVNFLVLCLILFLLGTNYQNNLILFLLFFLCSFMVTCLLLSYRNLANLTLTANQVQPQFAGRDCAFSLRIVKEMNLGQQINCSFKNPSSALKSRVTEQQCLIYALAHKRGWFNPGRVTIRSTFPFGLFTVWTHLDFGFSVLLYPEPLLDNTQPLKFIGKNSNKGLTSTELGFEQFSMLKTYLPGESLKSVAWKQLAQGRGWLSKQFEQSHGGDVILDLEVYKNVDLETKLRLLCYQVIELEKNKINYSVKLGNEIIATGYGLEHKAKCLKALALYGIKP